MFVSLSKYYLLEVQNFLCCHFFMFLENPV